MGEEHDQSRFGKIVDSFRGMSAMTKTGASLGSLLPGIAFFTNYGPLGIPSSAILTSAVAVFVIFFFQGAAGTKKEIRRRSAIVGSVGFLLVFAYAALYEPMSVGPPPQREGPRQQIGFGTLEFSLKKDAREFLGEFPDATKEELMLKCRGYAEGPEVVWKSWTITLAGALMALLFFSGFILWTAAFTLLGKATEKKRGK